MIPARTEKRLADALRLTASVAIACRDAGITPRDYERLAADDEALRARLEHARHDGVAAHVERLRGIAIAGGTPEQVFRLGAPVFGWWDTAAGQWIDPDAWPGGEDALRRAATQGAGIERKAVTRLTSRAFHLLLAYLRHVEAPAAAERRDRPEEEAAERVSNIKVPPILPVEEWMEKHARPAAAARKTGAGRPGGIHHRPPSTTRESRR